MQNTSLRNLILAASAGLLAAGASADDLFIASTTSAILKGNPAQGDFELIGLCGGPAHSLLVDGEDVFVGDQSGNIYLFDASAGALGYAFTGVNDATAMVLHDDQLLISGSDSTVQRFTRNGALLETLSPGVPVEAMLLDGDVLYVGSSFGLVVRADLNDGVFSFWGTCGGPIESMAFQGSELLLATTGGVTYRLDRNTQQVLGAYALPIDASAIVSHAGDLLVGGVGSLVHRVGATSGTPFMEFSLEVQGFPVTSADAMVVVSSLDPGNDTCYGNSCPCGNDDPDAGCENSTGQGAVLRGSGSASIAADDLFLTSSGLPANSWARYYMGAAPNALPFGNGLLCAGSGGYGQFRFPIVNAGAGGFVSLGLGVVEYSEQNFNAQGQVHPGFTWIFQVWYRDPGGLCGSSFNTSNAYHVTFQP